MTVPHHATVAAIFVAAGAVNMVHAQTVLYSTSFSAPTYANGPLAGQDSWVPFGSFGSGPPSVSDAGGTGGVALGASGRGASRDFAPVLASSDPLAAGSVWLSVELSVFNITGPAAVPVFLSPVGASGASPSLAVLLRSAPGGGGFQMAMTYGSTSSVVYGPTMPFGPLRIVARYDIVPGADFNDGGAMFVNPVNPYGVGDTAYVGASPGLDADSFGRVALSQNSLPPYTLSGEFYIESLSVAYIPTPSAAALLGFGGLFAARRRR